MARIAKIIAGATLATLALAGCSTTETPSGDTSGTDNPLGTVEAGALTVCSDPPFAPFEFEDPDAPSGYSGFDIDLSGAIAEKLGLTLVVVDTDFDALQSGASLAAGMCDLGASGITITPEREASLDFTEPYYDALQSLMVAKDSGIASLDDMGGMSIGVQTGTTGETYAEENMPSDASLVAFPSDGEMWAAILSGQVDALLQDHPVNLTHTKDDPNYAVVARYETDEQYGFAMAKGKNPELRDAVSDALDQLRQDGTYDTLYATYFG